MKVLLIGGTGFIGKYVVQQLSSQGHEVAMFTRGIINRNQPFDAVTNIIGDLHNLSDYRADFQAFAPEVVIHMIASTEKAAQLANTTFNGIAQRIVAISSMDVYQAYGIINQTEDVPLISVPLNEDSPLRQKLYPYGGDYEKIVMERAMLENTELPAAIVRLPMVYGPGDHFHRLYKYLKRMLDQRPAIVLDQHFADWRTTRGYVENVAAAIVAAAVNKQSVGRVFNAGEPEGRSEKEWILSIANEMGWTGSIVGMEQHLLPDTLQYHKNLQQDWVMDTSRIRTELHYNESISPKEALQRTIHWEIANPPEQLDARDYPPLEYAEEDRLLLRLGL